MHMQKCFCNKSVLKELGVVCFRCFVFCYSKGLISCKCRTSVAYNEALDIICNSPFNTDPTSSIGTINWNETTYLFKDENKRQIGGINRLECIEYLCDKKKYKADNRCDNCICSEFSVNTLHSLVSNVFTCYFVIPKH